MSTLLKNKTAVITGCNRGIGEAILRVFAQNGANIYAVTRKENPEFVQKCRFLERDNNVSIKQVYADFSNENEVKQAANAILADKTPIDILINNIGTATANRILTMTPMQSIRDIMEVNYFATISFTQKIVKNMMRYKDRGGSIVFISSIAAADGFSNLDYCSSKAALEGATHRLAVELGPFNIRVNAIEPGIIGTELFHDTVTGEDLELAVQGAIMKREGKPEELANAVLFFASDLSSFITSQVLRVDGGGK